MSFKPGMGLPAFNGTIRVYSTKTGDPVLKKTMPSPAYIDETGFNSDERRIKSVIQVLEKADSNVVANGKLDINTGSCNLLINGYERIRVHGNDKKRIITMVLPDNVRKQLFNWIVDIQKDIRPELATKLMDTVKDCIKRLQKSE